ncbi:MAG: M23 family metallopeptidase [Bacteroidales bacterium]|nr:M23 family metallopeptidase [Bacteroidales bacterium]
MLTLLMNGNKILIYGLFLLLCVPAMPQDTLVSANDTIPLTNDTIIITPPHDTLRPANELYQNTWSLEHVRHRRLEHTDTTILELITPETPVFSMPARDFNVLSKYGMRSGRMHTGIDLRQRPTDTLFAVFDGMVRMAKWYSSYGNLVVIRHANGLETVYSHLSEIHVQPFQTVRAGESIGLAGRTGRATTDHLHFEVRFFYEHFDPNLLIDFEEQCLRVKTLMFVDGQLVLETEDTTDVEEMTDESEDNVLE